MDDAIIAVEMMSVQLERGMERFDAACYAFTQTAKPMLTGTLITCAGFIPVAFSKGMASEFCAALFPVIGIALVLSWIVSVMIAPLFGYYLIRVKKPESGTAHDPYDSPFYQLFRRVLTLFSRTVPSFSLAQHSSLSPPSPPSPISNRPFSRPPCAQNCSSA